MSTKYIVVPDTLTGRDSAVFVDHITIIWQHPGEGDSVIETLQGRVQTSLSYEGILRKMGMD